MDLSIMLQVGNWLVESWIASAETFSFWVGRWEEEMAQPDGCLELWVI